MDVAPVLLLLGGWVAVSLVVVVPVCLLLRGAEVLEQRARPCSGRRARTVRRPVRWVRHATGGTVVAVRRVRRTAGRW